MNILENVNININSDIKIEVEGKDLVSITALLVGGFIFYKSIDKYLEYKSENNNQEKKLTIS